MRSSVSKKIQIYSLSLFIPASIILLICVLTQVYPFGNKTLLISDLSNQYVDYFAYYKTIFIGKNDFLYTFSKKSGRRYGRLFRLLFAQSVKFHFCFSLQMICCL